jgi:hypothetical protein
VTASVLFGMNGGDKRGWRERDRVGGGRVERHVYEVFELGGVRKEG